MERPSAYVIGECFGQGYRLDYVGSSVSETSVFDCLSDKYD